MIRKAAIGWRVTNARIRTGEEVQAFTMGITLAWPARCCPRTLTRTPLTQLPRRPKRQPTPQHG
jgi:hypothetical protein